MNKVLLKFSVFFVALFGCVWMTACDSPSREPIKARDTVEETEPVTIAAEPVKIPEMSITASLNEDAYFYEGDYFDIDTFDKIMCILNFSTGDSVQIAKEMLSCNYMDTNLPAGDVTLVITYDNMSVELPIWVEPYVEEVVYEPPAITYDYQLGVPLFMQLDYGLPSGCEGTALAMCINYLGYGVSPYDLCETYMPKDYNCTDPYVAFIGDPADPYSFGCASPVVIQTAYNYMAASGAPLQVIDHTGDLEGVYNEIASGYPVAVCVSENFSRPFWFVDTLNGTDYFWWHASWHYIAVVGVNDYTVTVNDPLYGYYTVDKGLFEWIWWEMGAQAVAVH
ncbi:MAG: hypothetical protein E7242_06110 [Lachnospiraceae bacterium]|nr:hypothetical protein [Lachnospiraceae bacterium]